MSVFLVYLLLQRMGQLISQWTIATEDIKTEFRKKYGMNYVSDFIFQQMMPKLYL